MQVELFQLVHSHGRDAIAHELLGPPNLWVGLRELGIELCEVGTTDDCVFVRTNQYDWGAARIPRYGIGPEVRKSNRGLPIALAIGLAFGVAIVQI